MIRNIEKDARAKDPPTARSSLYDLLKANFKRAEEGLRVLEEYTGNSLYSHLRYDLYQLEKDIVLNSLKKQIFTGIYLISDQPDILIKGLQQGVSLIQLRDKRATKSEVLKKAQFLQKKARNYAVPFIINDYLDIVLAVDADGLHTGQDDIPVSTLRKLLGPHKLIGRTTHSLTQGLRAQKEGADYVSVGPIWETPSKPGRKGIGLSYLAQAKEQLNIPYVAIGGIDLQTVDALIHLQPPLIGLIRDHLNIPSILKKLHLST